MLMPLAGAIEESETGESRAGAYGLRPPAALYSAPRALIFPRPPRIILYMPELTLTSSNDGLRDEMLLHHRGDGPRRARVAA